MKAGLRISIKDLATQIGSIRMPAKKRIEGSSGKGKLPP